MTQRGLTSSARFVCLTATLTAVELWMAGSVMASTVRAVTGAPAQLCASYSLDTLHALKHGTTRVVVVVRAIQSTKPPSTTLVVSLLTNNKTQRHEITRFAVHPLQAFSAQEPKRTQRFLVSLEEQARLIEEEAPLCLEVGFDIAGSGLEGGSAEIDIELVELSRNKSK